MTAAVIEPALRVQRVTGAFVSLGVTEAMAYPLLLLLNNVIGPTSYPIVQRFVARLVESGASVGFDYYTFVILGFSISVAMTGGVGAFGGAVDSAIQQGRLEMFLVQPISWYTLPFALAAWPITLRTFNAIVTVIIGVALGAHLSYTGLPLALVLLALGIACSHAIGTLAASVRLLSKKADPVVTIYGMAAAILSGALFPVEMLPSYIRVFSYLLPHTYVISGMRRLLMPNGDTIAGPSLTTSILVLTATALVLYVVCLIAFGKALDFGRRYGVLGGY